MPHLQATALRKPPKPEQLKCDQSIKINLQIPSKADVQIIIYKYIKNAIYRICHSLEREY